MEAHPLESLTVDEAKELQFSLVDEITQVFSGTEILTGGDLGVVSGLNQPQTTKKVESVLANFFATESAMLVRGAGTMAIRLALHALVKSGDTILVHRAPIYPTTKSTLEMSNINVQMVDFNNLAELEQAVQTFTFKAVLIQATRQQPTDSYELSEVIKVIKTNNKTMPIITDDNYAVCKIPKIGVQLGATLSCFSTFKLLGPVGVGCIVGSENAIKKLRKENYSGGLQVQGFEALQVLRGLIYAPVSLAISATVTTEVCTRLNNGEVAGVKAATIVNAQSKVIIVELEAENAGAVLGEADKLGAAPHPVGAESKYEFIPMFYRLSGTFLKFNKGADKTMLRINPMRSGSNTIIRILSQAIANAQK